MFENWILADVDSLKAKGYVRLDSAQREYDGTHGAKELGRLMDRRYKKTTDGPRFFKCTNLATAAQNSPSFHRFMQSGQFE